MKSRSRLMLEKSIAAILSAIEIYNKPDFKYREETFSVLCINSWELLLKAQVLHLSSNKLSSIYKTELKTLKSGNKSTSKSIKKNRSGNAMSINLFEAYNVITNDFGLKINKVVYENLLALTEIRDNSIHFINDDFTIAIKIQELGTAALQNYLHLVNEWFGNVLAKYNFYLMPISFFRDFQNASGTILNNSEKNVLDYIKKSEQKYDDNDFSDYNLTLRIDLKFQKVKSTSGLPVIITNDPAATVVQLSEEDISDKYPWNYDVLSTRCIKRYVEFKVNKKYHDLRKQFESDQRYAYQRLLDPSNPNSSKKTFYNANIFKEFDKYYEKK
ncbi:DUF3644 domain-containing protein [Acinetobacter sp. SwsAc6]|uniref:DUF3644 domain-containing protein n=1 Tax=Acinetobacter sp. SwsAc6 TaxID=2749439 RepID=UPI0015C0D149|nr:DUF3644 domain-containing protein [Acinetobacter sp. SwsAc6]NWK73201.1 DUF3644 domain-containing protein [Acinetobacter sp. SwsAc6]